MAKQDGGRAEETQPKPILPLSLGSWAHDGKLQEFMGPLGTVGPRREIKATLASLQR